MAMNAISSGKDIVSPALLRLQPCQPIDCTSLVPGVSGLAAVVDLLSGSQLGRVDLGSEPVDMCFSPEAALLIVAVAEWHIYVVSLSTWRSRVLVPRRQKAEKPLEGCLLAVSAGPAPVVYFCKFGKELLRMASTTAQSADPRVTKAANWGTKIKLDVVKPVLGLAAHPSDPQLLILHADGFIRGYLRQSAELLVPLYSYQVHDKIPSSLPAAGTFEVVPHPTVPGGALVLQAARLGSIAILEVLARSAPTLLLKTKMAGWAAVLGMGLQQDNSLLLIFGLTEAGKVRSGAWKVLGKANQAGLTLTPARVEPMDLSPLLDSLGRAKAQAAAASCAAPGAAGGGAATAWQSLWAPLPAWSTDVSSSVLLDQQLAPLISRVVVHPSLGVVAALLEPSLVVQTNNAMSQQPFGQLLSEELAIAKRTASVPLLTLSNAEAYLGGWRGGLASPMHTGLTTWQGASVLGGTFQFPCHYYYVSGGKVFKYAPAARFASPLVGLPAEASDGSARVARHLTHSYKQSAWLVQFEALGASESYHERWQWTLMLPAAFEGSAAPVWFKSGKYPTFVGPSDAHIAVIEPAGKAVAVFAVASTVSAAAPPAFTISLESCAIHGCASPLFSGPPCLGVPQAPHRPDDTEQGDPKAERARRREAAAGAGAVMWQTSDNQLAMASLGSLIRVSAVAEDDSEVDDSSDDDEIAATRHAARAKRQAIPTGSHLGVRVREAALPLLPGERVLQVAWQQLSTVAPVAPEDVAAGVLTTQRVLLVSGNLRLLASAEVGVGACLSHPITSVLWAGPALLYCTITGQVMQLSWSGSTHAVASVAPGSHLLLAGVTPDALLLLRATDAAGIDWEPVVRPTAVLQPLVLGWAGLAASGLLPSGTYAGRSAIQALLAKFDVGSVTPSLVWSLISTWAADVAALLAAQATQLDASTRFAAQAAAGQWGAVTASLMAELDSSIAFPKPPLRGSVLHAKIVAAAAGCAMHGQWVRAVGLLRAAGEWRSAMVVAVCQGNLAAVQQAAHDAGATGSQAEAAEAERVAAALRSLYASTGGLVADSTLQLTSGDGNEIPLATNWTLGGLGMVPQGNAVAGDLLPPSLVGQHDAGPIPPTSHGDALSFLGLGPTVASQLVMARPARIAAGKVPSSPDGGNLDVMQRTNSGSTQRSSANAKKSSLGKASLDSLGLEAPQNDAQAAARAEFLREAGIIGGADTPGELSSDEDLDSLAGSNAGARRIRVQIRERDESLGPQASNADALKEAAKNLRLSLASPTGPKVLPGVRPGRLNTAASGDLVDLSTPKSSLAPALSGGRPGLSDPLASLAPPPPPPGSMAAAQLQQRQQQQTQQRRLPPPPQALSQTPPTAQPLVAPLQPGQTSVTLYQQGVALMESANWQGAAAAFAQAIDALHQEPRGPTTAQRIAFCAQYYAAVRLLESAAGSPHKGFREACLYRHIASLKLDDRHQAALVRESIAHNRDVGNLRYAADQLTWMVAKCLEAEAPMEYMQQLQEDIDACDRAGGGNNDIPSAERLEDWATAVAAAGRRQDIDAIVDPLLGGAASAATGTLIDLI